MQEQPARGHPAHERGGAESGERQLAVGEAAAGRRLDVFLAEALALSRAQVRRLLRRGAVRLDGREVGEGAKGVALSPGAQVSVAAFVPPGSQRPVAEPTAPLSLLAEGPGWVALDKPAGTPVHPLAEGERGSLLGALVARRPEVEGVGEGGLRSGVVHRLDVDTSGVVLFATDQDRWRQLRAAFAERRIDKRYRALVAGQVAEPGEAELLLVTARHRPARVRVVGGAGGAGGAPPRGAKPALTRWRPLERFRDATLLEVSPATGFLHQIRVVLAHLGHPILGDRAYAPPAQARAAPRQLLHAASLHFEDVRAESPDPPDLSRALARLRREGGPTACGT